MAPMSVLPIRVIAVVPAALLLLQPLLGQQGGASPQPVAPTVQPGAGTASPPPTTAPATVPPVWTPPPPSQPLPAIPQEHPEPAYVSGRVISDDGRPLTGQVTIESVCDGVSHVEGFADSEGGFAFRLGDRNSGMFQDASVSSRTITSASRTPRCRVAAPQST